MGAGRVSGRCLEPYLAGYGLVFLQLVASIYPGYDATSSFGEVIVGTLYALVDGAATGLLFCWLYNLFARKEGTA